MRKKHLICALTAALLLLGITACGDQDAANIAAPEQDIVILYTNDVHCGIDEEEGIGYAGLADIEKQYEKDGAEVILADCGDAIQGSSIGTLSEGECIIDIMNEMDYDIAAIGNHEFDYGMERFMELSQHAEFPYVSCNFVDLQSDETVFRPYEIMEVSGVDIAFVGISTPETLTSSAPAYFQDEKGNLVYSFCQGKDGQALYDSVQQAVDDARAEGADYVIALGHLGIDEASSPWMSTEVIANTTGIDVLLDGHSHDTVECDTVEDKDGQEVILSQTGTKLSSAGVLTIGTDGKLTTELISKWKDDDPQMAAFIDDIQSEYKEELQRVVAKANVELTTVDPQTGERLIRSGETNLGDLCADAYRVMTGADIAILNGGGIRDNIDEGDITYEEILNVHPFGNAVCMVEADGQDILDALELGACMYPEENGSFLQVSGITFEIDPSVPSSVRTDEDGMFEAVEGPYRVKNVMVGGETLDPDKTYTLACHDYYLKDSGGGFTMFEDNVMLLDSIMQDHQALMEYITKHLGRTVGEEYADPYGQGRIVIR